MATIGDIVNGVFPQKQQTYEPKGWQKAVGLLGDALQAYAGGRGTFLPYLQQQRQREQEMQQAWNLAEMQGQQQMDRWKAQEQYKRDNPAPTDLQRNYEWLLQSDPQAAANYKSRQTNDTVWRQGPDGRFYPYDPTPQAPQAPVGKLRPYMSNEQGGQTLGAAAQSKTISPQQAQAVRESLGPNGQAAFEKWMRDNNIVIGGN